MGGVLVSPGILEDRLWLGAPGGKLILGSANHSGINGLANGIIDRCAVYTAKVLKVLGADGCDMLIRIHYGDSATVVVMETTAGAGNDLAELDSIITVESFVSATSQGKMRTDFSAEAVIKSAAIASVPGQSPACTW